VKAIPEWNASQDVLYEMFIPFHPTDTFEAPTQLTFENIMGNVEFAP